MKNRDRLLTLPDNSFFLFGPRGVGKSTLINDNLRNVLKIDLLKGETYTELSRNTSLIEAKIGNKPPGSWIFIDEVQKLPTLLDEVHRLIEDKKYKFALSGSSARKLKRGGANLLAGRAITKNLSSFCYPEIKDIFSLESILSFGSLPLVVLNQDQAKDILNTYVQTYIKEEIKEEGIVRKVEPFLRFIEVAAILNGQQLNLLSVARDASIPRSTVDTYFSILEETLLGLRLYPFQPQAMVREATHPKFYWFDSGVARAAAGLIYEDIDSVWLGYSLETFILHEIMSYNNYAEKHRQIFFYRSSNQQEIDFVIQTKKRTNSSPANIVLIEVKYSKKWKREWEYPMRSLSSSDKVNVVGMYGIYNGSERYNFDGIEVLPIKNFLEMLYNGEVF